MNLLIYKHIDEIWKAPIKENYGPKKRKRVLSDTDPFLDAIKEMPVPK